MRPRLAAFGILACLVAAGVLYWKGSAHAEEAGDGYELVSSNIGAGDSGGSGDYEVATSAGQPVVGEVSAGDFTMGLGYWGGGEVVLLAGPYLIYLPLATK
jgi:hypothetical protein